MTTPRHSPATVFLDRDGTLIVEKHYLCDPDLVELETGVVTGLRALQAAGHRLVVASNQSGIGRGRFPRSAAEAVNQRVADLLGQEGIHIEGWYMCPHAPEQPCGCRKPATGMGIQAALDLELSLDGCYMIGDKRIDVEFGQALGGLGLLVGTGHGQTDLAWAQSHGVPTFSHFESACQFILQRTEAVSPSII